MGGTLAFASRLRFTRRVKITEFTDQLIASYASVGGINHLDGTNLPSKSGIVSLTTDLLALLFPGFFDNKVTHSSEIKMETALLMDSVAGRLEDELVKCFTHAPPNDTAEANPRTTARKMTLQFLAQLPAVRKMLTTDVDAAFDGDPAARAKKKSF